MDKTKEAPTLAPELLAQIVKAVSAHVAPPAPPVKPEQADADKAARKAAREADAAKVANATFEQIGGRFPGGRAALASIVEGLLTNPGASISFSDPARKAALKLDSYRLEDGRTVVDASARIGSGKGWNRVATSR